MTEPAWTERTDKRGLDPLGIQNAGVNLYQDLLPGISNVTLRVRYYGFYCWVSDAYGTNDGSTEYRAWKLWVRRAEATYALVAAHVRGQGGVGGCETARQLDPASYRSFNGLPCRSAWRPLADSQ